MLVVRYGLTKTMLLSSRFPALSTACMRSSARSTCAAGSSGTLPLTGSDLNVGCEIWIDENHVAQLEVPSLEHGLHAVERKIHLRRWIVRNLAAHGIRSECWL